MFFVRNNRGGVAALLAFGWTIWYDFPVTILLFLFENMQMVMLLYARKPT